MVLLSKSRVLEMKDNQTKKRVLCDSVCKQILDQTNSHSNRKQIHSSLGPGEKLQKGVRKFLRMLERLVIPIMLIVSCVCSHMFNSSNYTFQICEIYCVSIISQRRCLKMRRGEWKERLQQPLWPYTIPYSLK